MESNKIMREKVATGCEDFQSAADDHIASL
jgi:hypothetical protein